MEREVFLRKTAFRRTRTGRTVIMKEGIWDAAGSVSAILKKKILAAGDLAATGIEPNA